MKTDGLTHEELTRLLQYTPEDGVFTWRERTPDMFKEGKHSAAHCCAKWNSAWAGKRAGSLGRGDGYRAVIINRVQFLAHRLAWFYVNRSWPEVIDHENGDRDDNRIVNLRSTTHLENHKNQSIRTCNTSGVVGVSFLKKRRVWQARIMVNHLQIPLGHYRNFEDAVAARKAAELKHGFHINHGTRNATYKNN